MKICLSCEGVAATEQDRCTHCDVPLLPVDAAHYPRRRGEADAANPLLGSVIDGKYLLQGVLGRGGMGTVFRACHSVSLVPVALKLLHPRLSVLPEYRRALLAEARRAGRVVHEHCARVLDVGETEEGTVYLAMELVDGDTLDVLVQAEPLAPSIAVEILVQVCRALVAIHAADLVHRDLSARNVMVSVREGAPYARVLDFGIAQPRSILSPRGDEGRGERAFANPISSAPEHLAGLDVDVRADLYSLGVLAYLLLTGELPVQHQDPQKAAQATIEGRLRPMGSLPGVPRRLARLVNRCLHRDPEQRPATAQAVLTELLGLQSGRFRWLPRASLFALAAAVVVATVTFARATPPFLRLSGPLVLAEGGPATGAPIQHLTSEELGLVRGHFGGFPVGLLEVELARGSTPLRQQVLAPEVDRDGVLVLSDAQPQWREVISSLASASAQGAVDLVFAVPGQALLGGARVRIDDERPVVQWHLEGGGGGLRRDTKLRLAATDSVGVERLQVDVRLQTGAAARFDLPVEATEFDLGMRLAERWDRVDPIGPGEVEVAAFDAAGNRSAAAGVPQAYVDVGVPFVQQITGPRDLETAISYVERRAVLRLRLSELEAGLRLSVFDPDGAARDVTPQALAAAAVQEVELGAAATGEPFATGLYRFVIEDPVGNRAEREFALVFRSSRIEEQFSADAAAPVRFRPGEIVCGPEGAEFALRCNPAFQLVGVREPGGARLDLESAGPGLAQVRLPARESGSRRLVFEFEHGDRRGGVPETIERAWTVLPATLQVLLPDVQQRFLPGLIEAGLLAEATDPGGLVDGSAVRVEADLRQFLDGNLWFGADLASLSAQPLSAGAEADRHLWPPLRPLPGRNLLLLELQDVLGRPVEVRAGDRRVEPLGLADQKLTLVAEFWTEVAPPRTVGEELRVEYGQSATLQVRCGLPFGEEDRPRLRLAVGTSEIPAVDVTSGERQHSDVSFVLTFAMLASAEGLEGVARPRYSDNIRAVLRARLHTPAGSHPLDIQLRTARTTLRVVDGSELGGEPGVVAPAGLVFVPVLAPVSGTLPDPVPADAPGREHFRPQPWHEITIHDDFFVLDREFTIEQYGALLDALRGGAVATDTRRGSLVHADDPRGDERLTIAGMVPAATTAAHFAQLRRTTPTAAVTGLDFFQAFAASRLLGVVLGGDPELFRLPLGCELELAAFGGASGVGLHAVAAHGGAVQLDRFGAAAAGRDEVPSAADCAAAGDVVTSAFGTVIHGLDFGVREWVLDLPPGDRGRDLLAEWVTDRERHAQRALAFADGDPAPPDLRWRLRRFAVVRGAPFGADAGLLAADGRELAVAALLAQGRDALPASVPGVVRSETMQRSGRGLGGEEFDPRLLRTGFRVVGDAAFVARVRGR